MQRQRPLCKIPGTENQLLDNVNDHNENSIILFNNRQFFQMGHVPNVALSESASDKHDYLIISYNLSYKTCHDHRNKGKQGLHVSSPVGVDTKYYRDNVMLDAGKRTLESSYYNIKQNFGNLCLFARQTIQTISILSHLTF